MSQTVLGFQGMVEQPPQYGWSPNRGVFSRRVWEGAGALGKYNARGLANQLRNLGVEFEVVDQFGKSVVTATYGSDQDGRKEVPDSTWEVRMNRISKDLFESPDVSWLKKTTVTVVPDYSIQADNAATTTLLEVLQRCVASKKSGEGEAYVGRTATSDKAKAFWEIYDLAMSGVKEFIVEQAVVVHKQTMSNQYAARTIADTNQGKVFTEAQMKKLEGAPAESVETIELPTGYVSQTQSTNGYWTFYGYRKSRPEMHQIAFNKWEVVTSYEQGFWTSLLYSPAI